MRRGTFKWMKSVNKSIILNKIRTSEPISRAQVAKETKITPPTVSSVVKELIEEGIIKESEAGESQGGRKPTMLMINSRAFYIIGVDAGPETVDYVLSDLSGNIIEYHSKNLELPLTNMEFLTILKDGIQAIINATKSSKEIIGIGVAMHGVVDVETGISWFAPNLALSNIPIKEELEKEFALVVKVENDARAFALGEAWFGNHGELNSMLAVNIGRGVGGGVIINGRLYHGATDLSGEIGHMMVDINGEVCQCGNRGCLQTLVSGPAIANRARVIMHDTMDGVEPANLTGKKVYHLATEGNEKYANILAETGTFIGIGLTNLIHVLNPGKIVLGGGVAKASEFIMEPIIETIRQRALTWEAKQTEVVITKLGDNATLLGAVALLLVEIFDLD